MATKGKSTGKSVGDTAKMKQSEFSVRARQGVLNNRDKSSYEIPKPKKGRKG